jgi:hypothetical protein
MLYKHLSVQLLQDNNVGFVLTDSWFVRLGLAHKKSNKQEVVAVNIVFASFFSLSYEATNYFN